MWTKISTVYLSLCLTLCVSDKVTLKCSSNPSKSTCRCDMKIDSLTSFPIIEALCQYLELDELPILNLADGLNSLDLSHNNLRRLIKEDVSFKFGEIIFNLKFCHNTIDYVDNVFFHNFPHLVYLDLSHNALPELQSDLLFEKTSDLEVLDLSFNRIQSVADGIFKNLEKLKEINLSYNPLHKILENPTAIMDKLGINQNILHVSLDNVGVTRIHTKCWHNFKKLKYLSVTDNPITEIPQTASSLEYLDISGTNLTNLHENYLKYPNLKVLKMARMENLTDIPPYSFNSLEALEEFVLTDSDRVTHFNEYVFGALGRNFYPKALRKLNLARNRLNTLNETFQYIIQDMVEVDLSFNSWRCDCDVLWMKDFEFNMRRKYDMKCASPGEVTNMRLLELEPKDVPDCFPAIYGKKSHQTALLVLIIIIFVLVVVIVYLCLYSPSWSIKIGRSKMSPESPYSINNEQI